MCAKPDVRVLRPFCATGRGGGVLFTPESNRRSPCARTKCLFCAADSCGSRRRVSPSLPPRAPAGGGGRVGSSVIESSCLGRVRVWKGAQGVALLTTLQWKEKRRAKKDWSLRTHARSNARTHSLKVGQCAAAPATRRHLMKDWCRLSREGAESEGGLTRGGGVRKTEGRGGCWGVLENEGIWGEHPGRPQSREESMRSAIRGRWFCACAR